jgi:uncharacterized membrane protein YcaP (DUF421 family)
MDWEQLFVPSGSLAEIVVRGTVLYLVLFAMLRLLPRRQLGSLGVSDVLVIVLIADAAQNGLAGDYKSITEGVVLVATILFWDYAIDWADRKFPGLHLNPGEPLPLVHNGRIIERNLARGNITERDLMSQILQQGIDDLRAVKDAYAEGDGSISVIKSRHFKARESEQDAR